MWMCAECVWDVMFAPLLSGDIKHLGSQDNNNNPDTGINMKTHMHVDTLTLKHSFTL